MNIGKKKTLIVVVLMLVVFVSSISYAVWTSNYEQTNPNVLTAGCFKLDLSEQSSAIALTNSYPISDTEGRSLKPYTFTVKNICTIDAVYDISLDVLEQTTFNLDSIKIKFSDNLPKLLTAYPSQTARASGVKNSFLLTTGKLKAATTANGTDGGSITYNLRLWIDESSTEMEKNFASNIVVTSSVATPKIIASGDISKTKECDSEDKCSPLTGNNVTYDYYDNGSLVIKGNGETAIENDYGMLVATVFFEYLNENIIFNESLTEDEEAVFASEQATFLLPLLGGNYNLMSKLIGISPEAEDYDEYMVALRNVDLSLKEEFFTVAEKIHGNFPVISAVTIEEGVTSIGEGILSGLGNYEIILPKSLRTIEALAIQMSNSKINMSQCSLLQSIGNSAFVYSSGANLFFPSPSQLVTIESQAFAYSTLTSMILPDSVEVLGNNLFVGSSIQSLRLPANKKYPIISNNLLQGATELTEVIIPPNVTSIAEDAFLSQDHDELTLKFIGPERTITNLSGEAFNFSGYKIEWNYE